jgi:hypothetical protein
MMMNTTEFSVITEAVTASMTMPLESGEHFGGPISIGYYPGNNSEIWIEFEDARLNIQRASLKDFIKQLRRADSIAAEQ